MAKRPSTEARLQPILPDPGVRTQAVQVLTHWREDDDLAGVRDADALAKLPDAERQEWQKLWQEVEALCKQPAQQH